MKVVTDMVEGKSVALVGNAKSLLSQNKADEIDAHDVVIRINQGLPRKVRNVGTRTDLWVTARHFPAVDRSQFQAILFMKLTRIGDREWKLFQREQLSVPLIRWPRELADECVEFCQCDPGCGLRMLWLLKKKLQPKSVDVYGMDCWRTESTWQSGWNPRINHNPERERELVELLCRP